MLMHVLVKNIGRGEPMIGVLQEVVIQDDKVGYIVSLEADECYFFERSDTRVYKPKTLPEAFRTQLIAKLNEHAGHSSEPGEPSGSSLSSAILGELEAGPKSADQLAEALDSTKRSVQSTISRLRKSGVDITKVGDYYGYL